MSFDDVDDDSTHLRGLQLVLIRWIIAASVTQSKTGFLWKRRYNFALSYQSQLHFQLSETDLLFPDNFHAFQIDHHWLMELGEQKETNK